jgi:regulator of protease activity HflC (stomatin/prohibitin superfamily)
MENCPRGFKTTLDGNEQFHDLASFRDYYAMLRADAPVYEIPSQPGLYFVNPCGLNLRYVSVNNRTHELQSIKVADALGNSLVVSGVITFRVVDSTKAALDMENMEAYTRIQAHAVLKRLCSRFPYITYDASPSLMTEQASLGGQLAQMLQEKVDVAGVHVLSFELVDLSYSAEIAPQMLVRQQAQAIVDARKTIVAGAVGIVGDALDSLRDRGVEVGAGDQPRFVGNLMTVLCSEKSPVPTIDM